MAADYFIYESITRKINRRPYDFFKFENFMIYMNSQDVLEEQEAGEFPESHILTQLKNCMC